MVLSDGLPSPCSAPQCRSKALFSESFSLLLSHYPGKMVTLAVQSVFTMETSWKGGHAAPRSSQVRLCIPSFRRWLWSSFPAPWHGWAVPMPVGPLAAVPGASVPCAHPAWCQQCPGAEGAAGAHRGSRTSPSPRCPSGAALKDTGELMVKLEGRAVSPGHRERDAPRAGATCAPRASPRGSVTQRGTTAPVGVCARLVVEHRAPVPAGHWGLWGSLMP